MAVCRKCGNDLDHDGACAACLLAGGFGTEVNEPTVANTEILPGNDVEASQALENDSFGSYRILRLLGEGGMGAVYLAQQTEPLKRAVALKVVKLGWTPAKSSPGSATSARRWR